ncbi:MAG: GTPase HflX [Deltaproteobacteria bacterium]|nr:GTPase HflX [Deltaproteobacteria bacterium]
MKTVHGNTQGLKASETRALSYLYRRRVDPMVVVSADLAREMLDLATEIARQVGVIIDRQGRIEAVAVGNAHKIHVPDVGRERASRGRLRGVRWVHTHLRGEPLTGDDLHDLAALRLDLVAAVHRGTSGLPESIDIAHLVPENTEQTLWRRLPRTPFRRLDVDPTSLVLALEAEAQRLSGARATLDRRDRAVLIHASSKSFDDIEAEMAELAELARSAGVAVLDRVVQRRRDIDTKYVIGRGKLEEISLRAEQLGADLLIFGRDLSPSQVRSIAGALEIRVVDRTQLILDIFAQRAHSRDGKVQVELAQLKYALPRLAEKHTGLSRLTGGIGGRGPGETKLEIERRRARDRIARLEREIDHLAKQRAVRRAERAKNKVPVLSIVGYTNAGKSTLLNTLTRANVVAEDKLFATLDPTSRRLRFPREREVVLTDTVGFIRDLPKDLVNAFRATLEELEHADILIHVADASSPQVVAQIAAVDAILASLDLTATPTARVLNKADRADSETLARLAAELDAIPLSAIDAATTLPLLTELERRLWGQYDTTHTELLARG